MLTARENRRAIAEYRDRVLEQRAMENYRWAMIFALMAVLFLSLGIR